MSEFYIRHEYWFAAAQLITAMLGMGATLKIRDFVAVFQKPRAVFFGLGIQILLVPLFAWAVISTADPVAGLAIGLALCAVIPGGTMSNVFTFLARGHTALSIALTAICSFACLLTTPIVLGLLISQHMPANFDMPAGKIAIEICLLLMLPLLCGMGVLAMRPEFGPRFSKTCIRLSIVVIIFIVVGASSAGRLDFDRFATDDLLLLCGFVAAMATFSWFVPRLLGLNSRDSTAINIEVTFRNGNLGLLIKASLFPAVVGVVDPVGDMVLFTVLLYGALAFPIAAAQVFLLGRKNKREQADAAPAAEATDG